ncbi:hypothetical protein L1280_002341 [Deinococcus sp. HSC-46F16]|uniref:DUF3800 domain-containing protein n=1 Tax=Deinococcus sp. HSC-46F16 TaxID=2910968 RepID=UPI00209E61C6|nr:DUF3800 domain-containing protein [Deinococcus sp. HSC-46F16]MCP2015180.1 hypothetical protein [Deinococcus sp. HSC-46F16]
MSLSRTYTLYLDETGDHSLTKINSQFPVFGLGGVIIDDGLLSEVTEQLYVVKQAIFDSPDIVLHSVELRKKKGEFRVLFQPEKMQEFYRKFNKFIETADLTFISIFIDKPKHLKRYKTPYDPYEWAMDMLLERFMHVLKAANAKGKIIVESRGRREDKEISAAFVRSMLLGTRYAHKAELNKFIEPVLTFEGKRENGVGLQLADMMLYPVARALINDDPHNPAYQIVASKMHNRYGCNVFPADAHPRWLTLSYTNHAKFLHEYPGMLIPAK